MAHPSNSIRFVSDTNTHKRVPCVGVPLKASNHRARINCCGKAETIGRDDQLDSVFGAAYPKETKCVSRKTQDDGQA